MIKSDSDEDSNVELILHDSSSNIVGNSPRTSKDVFIKRLIKKLSIGSLILICISWFFDLHSFILSASTKDVVDAETNIIAEIQLISETDVTRAIPFAELRSSIKNKAGFYSLQSKKTELTRDELLTGFEKFIEIKKPDDSLYYRSEAAFESLMNSESRNELSGSHYLMILKVLESLEKGLKLDPDDLPLLYDRARYLIFAHKLDEAREELIKIKKLLASSKSTTYPHHLSVDIALANYAYSEKRYSEAFTFYKQLISILESSNETKYIDIIVFERILIWNQYLTLFIMDSQTKQQENDIKLWIRSRMATILALSGEHDLAREQLEILLEERHNLTSSEISKFVSIEDIQLELAIMHAYSGDSSKAIDLANTVARKQPMVVHGFTKPNQLYLKAMLAKGMSYIRQDEYKKGLKFLKMYLKYSEHEDSTVRNMDYIAVATSIIIMVHSVLGEHQISLEYISNWNLKFANEVLSPGPRLELTTAEALTYYHLGDAEKLLEMNTKAHTERKDLLLSNAEATAGLHWMNSLYHTLKNNLPEAIAEEDRALDTLEGRTGNSAIYLRDAIENARLLRGNMPIKH